MANHARDGHQPGLTGDAHTGSGLNHVSKVVSAKIIALVKQANLQAIEWGGDVHVPPSNVARAREVQQRTRDAGLAVAAYGSYYRVGSSEQDGPSFQSVLDTAVALGAPLVRMWAGAKGSGDADATYWKEIADESRRIAERAGSAGVLVAYEYHGGTLTDTPASALRLLHDVNHPNLSSLWQPGERNVADEELQALQQMLPHVTNVHVFHWKAGGQERQPLADGTANWRRYLEVLRRSGRDHCVLIEFVRGDEPAMFLQDARTLCEWLQQDA